jgi:hypothetical protein
MAPPRSPPEVPLQLQLLPPDGPDAGSARLRLCPIDVRDTHARTHLACGVRTRTHAPSTSAHDTWAALTRVCAPSPCLQLAALGASLGDALCVRVWLPGEALAAEWRFLCVASVHSDQPAAAYVLARAYHTRRAACLLHTLCTCTRRRQRRRRARCADAAACARGNAPASHRQTRRRRDVVPAALDACVQLPPLACSLAALRAAASSGAALQCSAARLPGRPVPCDSLTLAAAAAGGAVPGCEALLRQRVLLPGAALHLGGAQLLITHATAATELLEGTPLRVLARCAALSRPRVCVPTALNVQ